MTGALFLFVVFLVAFVGAFLGGATFVVVALRSRIDRWPWRGKLW